jgi:hypothetical protein
VVDQVQQETADRINTAGGERLCAVRSFSCSSLDLGAEKKQDTTASLDEHRHRERVLAMAILQRLHKLETWLHKDKDSPIARGCEVLAGITRMHGDAQATDIC